MLKALKRLMAVMLVISLAFSFPFMFDQNAHAITTDFVTSEQDLDSILEKPYVDNVPTAFSEALFATHSTGWGFDNNTIFRSGIASGYGMPVTVKVNDISVKP